MILYWINLNLKKTITIIMKIFNMLDFFKYCFMQARLNIFK